MNAQQEIGKDNVAFIDVRTPEEYTGGHAAGAKNIPLDTINETAADQLRRFKDVYVICRSGVRSKQAVSKLLTFNVNAISVEGGTGAWRESELPVTT